MTIATLGWLAPAFLMSFTGAAAGADYAGRVVAVADGDTMTVVVGGNQMRLRLAEIDAPERQQPFGEQSKQALTRLCRHGAVTFTATGRDRDGRTLARVRCGSYDAQVQMVSRGMAWVFDRYVTDRSLYAIQVEARRLRRGLWAQPKPVPPWEWLKAAGARVAR